MVKQSVRIYHYGEFHVPLLQVKLFMSSRFTNSADIYVLKLIYYVGPMNNPYAAGFSAGGSSSGTAVLVQRGLADLGIGGDQGGSIRLPSSLCGIVGFKPTTGLVPYTGIASLEPVIDHAGPMTKVSA